MKNRQIPIQGFERVNDRGRDYYIPDLTLRERECPSAESASISLETKYEIDADSADGHSRSLRVITRWTPPAP